VLVENDAIPKTWNLGNNYPNPYNSSTTISYALPENSKEKIIIYNLYGREIKLLQNNFEYAS